MGAAFGLRYFCTIAEICFMFFVYKQDDCRTADGWMD